MVEMVLSLMFDSVVEGTGRKLGAFFEAAAKLPVLQYMYKYCEERPPSHSVLFSRNWAVQITPRALEFEAY